MSIDQPLDMQLDWTSAAWPSRTLTGPRVQLRPIRPSTDAVQLYAVSHPPDGDPSIWTYLFDGPYEDAQQMQTVLDEAAASIDPLFFSIVPRSDERPAGIASYLRITPEHGSVEIGNIWFGPSLRRTVAATEAIYLLARHAFDALGYRRLEWQCNALNAPSRRAAERFGFAYEGTFRNHRVVKGRNRDTSWYAIVAENWSSIRAGFERWLDDANFDPRGVQRRTLGALIAEAAGSDGASP